jgi:hypothetical protein
MQFDQLERREVIILLGSAGAESAREFNDGNERRNPAPARDSRFAAARVISRIICARRRSPMS